MNKKSRIYSKYAREAAMLIGKSIQLARKRLRYTASDFAERVGISRITLQKIEKGDLSCELGLVFEAAAVAGVALFSVDPVHSSFASLLESANDKLALLPKSIRQSKQDVDDDF